MINKSPALLYYNPKLETNEPTLWVNVKMYEDLAAEIGLSEDRQLRAGGCLVRIIERLKEQ